MTYAYEIVRDLMLTQRKFLAQLPPDYHCRVVVEPAFDNLHIGCICVTDTEKSDDFLATVASWLTGFDVELTTTLGSGEPCLYLCLE